MRISTGLEPEAATKGVLQRPRSEPLFLVFLSSSVTGGAGASQGGPQDAHSGNTDGQMATVVYTAWLTGAMGQHHQSSAHPAFFSFHTC